MNILWKFARLVVGVQKPDVGQQVTDGVGLGQGCFPRAIGSGNDPELGKRHAGERLTIGSRQHAWPGRNARPIVS